jgi:hypothetical protein
MKIIVLPTLLVVLCILSTGCVGQIKNVPANVTTVTTVNTFTPISNVTTIPETSTIPETPGIPGTSNLSGISNMSNITNSSGPAALKGQVRISLGAWVGEGTVKIDENNVGIATPGKPVTLMIEEGNHTVDVCCGSLCERKNVTIRFGQQQIMDFSEQLQKDCEFIEPTVRIIGYSMSADQITVNVEFINPTAKTVAMSAEITCGYSYIESRSDNRVGNVAQGQLYKTLNPGERVMEILDLNIASGYSYSYNIPTVTYQSR